MALTDEAVREILRIIDESELDELRIEMAGFRLHVRRGGAPPAAEPEPQPPRAGGPRGRPPEPAPEPTAPAEAEVAAANGAATIEAPMLGTFYRASAPGEQPFVDVGSEGGPDTVVCLIQGMKMM